MNLRPTYTELAKQATQGETESLQLKRTEMALRENEERYKALFENNPVETIIVDNEAKVTGYNLAKKRSQSRLPNIGDVMYADYAGSHEIDMHRELKECIRTGVLKEFQELRYKEKFLHIRISPFSGGAIITSIDITGLKTVKKERARLAAAMDQTGESVAITDLNGMIEYVNTAFEQNTGYTRQEIVGKDINLLWDEKKDAVFFKEIKNTLTEGSVWSGRLTGIRKDSTRYEAESTFSPVRDENGIMNRYVAVIRDATREIQLERMLFHSQKMEAIGTMAGGIAHDFNNILGSIMLNTELVINSLRYDSDSVYSLKQVLKASHRARDLVDQILTFSRDSEIDRKALNMNFVVTETLKMLRPMFPATIEIKENIQQEAGTVLANPTQIQQLVMNLCNNSAHAMKDKGGVLRVDLDNIHIDKPSMRPSLVPGHYVRLTVSDSGYGISHGDRERIFDPFFTTKQTGEGTGLGLSVVHGIVVKHEGAITVDSKPGEGTTFQIFLPKNGYKTSSESLESKAIPTGTGHILLVDDEEDLADVNCRMLERLGYQVDTVTSATAAHEMFGKDPDKYDLVITDMTMPQMTGFELSETLMRIRPGIPIILCTGYSENASQEKAKEIGIREYVTKPFTMLKMAETIPRALRK